MRRKIPSEHGVPPERGIMSQLPPLDDLRTRLLELATEIARVERLIECIESMDPPEEKVTLTA